MCVTVTDSIKYIGANDKTIDLFESQYSVPNGVSYNSYLILDEKIAVMDTIDKRATYVWLNNLKAELKDRTPDYLIVQHMEPDHAANIKILADMYPDMKLVGTAKTQAMIPQFFNLNVAERFIAVKEGDELNLGAHTLQFVMAPMIHWPEVMMTYEKSEKIFFSADAFGKFGTLDVEEEWTNEARRYYLNIVGKYGAQVQNVLKKAAGLDINMICPLHGSILKENLSFYLDKYNTWSSYTPEKTGVLIAYASMHGNTAEAAQKIGNILSARGQEVYLTDLSRDDMAEAVARAFYYDKLIVACPTYDAGLFPVMEDFLNHLKAKNYQKRKVGIMENGSWAPMAGKHMRTMLESMKNLTICENVVSILSTVKPETVKAMEELCTELLG